MNNVAIWTQNRYAIKATLRPQYNFTRKKSRSHETKVTFRNWKIFELATTKRNATNEQNAKGERTHLF